MSSIKKVQKIIAGSGLSRYEISKNTGLSESTLQRVVQPGYGSQFETIDKVLAAVGYEISIVKTGAKPKPTGSAEK